MKARAINEIRELDIILDGVPTCNFEEIPIAAKDGGTVRMLGNHKWLPIETTSDITLFLGEVFNITSDEWDLFNCCVLQDKKSIHYKDAILKGKYFEN